MVVAHGLVMCKEIPSNLPAYKFYAECKCGFQCRLGTLAAAQSQLDNHLVAHGEKAYFSNLAKTVAGEEQKSSGAGWKPSGAK